MSESEKNKHLSPILSDIQDYGPGAPAEEDRVELNEDAFEPEPEPEPEPESIEPGPDDIESGPDTSQLAEDTVAVEIPHLDTVASKNSGARWPIYLTSLLLVLAISGGATAAYWQQGRIEVLERQLQQLKRAKAAQAKVPDPAPEIAKLALASEELGAENAQLGEQLVQSRAEAEQLSIALAAAQAQAAEAVLAAEAAAAELVAVETAAMETAAVATAAVATAAVKPAPVSVDGWFVNLRSYRLEADARQWAAQLQDSPGTAQIVAVESNGGTMFRVRLPGFANKAEAQRWADKLRLQWGLSGPWISRD
ncbi:MAG: SPOR domain-containing protein [Halieaceae bacterium]